MLTDASATLLVIFVYKCIYGEGSFSWRIDVCSLFSRTFFTFFAKMAMPEFTQLFPDLPDEIGLECMTRLPNSFHGVASGVCRRWRDLLFSWEFYNQRKKSGRTRKVACLVQALPGGLMAGGLKSSGFPRYGITVFDPASQMWERLHPVPKFPTGLPLFCQVASCEGKLVVMGGWDPDNYSPITDVFIYDFTRRQWRKGKDMPSQRSFFAIGASEGRVYVAGGHDENKNALKSAWVYNSIEDEWAELTGMSQERDECEGRVIGHELWVVSGYGTDSQGVFEGSADVYDFQSDRWSQVEGAWEASRCPRSVGVGKDGSLTSYSELEAAVGVGTCGIELGSRTLISGSEYQGGQAGFYIAESVGGRNSKLSKINVHDDYLGFVQSGCCVEI